MNKLVHEQNCLFFLSNKLLKFNIWIVAKSELRICGTDTKTLN